MSSVTAMFLFNGFNSFLTQYPDSIEKVHENFNDGGMVESASLLQSIASAVDSRLAGRQADYPGVWEYEIVEPFGRSLAEWAFQGRADTVAEMVDSLLWRTFNWIQGAAVFKEPSPTAESLLKGFKHYMSSEEGNKKNKYSDITIIETVFLLENIAESAFKYALSKKASFPGDWQTAIVEPFGSYLAEWAVNGMMMDGKALAAQLCERTDNWIDAGSKAQ